MSPTPRSSTRRSSRPSFAPKGMHTVVCAMVDDTTFVCTRVAGSRFVCTKVADTTFAGIYDSLVAIIVRPQGEHDGAGVDHEIRPQGQAVRATAWSRPRPRPHGHAAFFDCIKVAGITFDYTKVSGRTFVCAKVAGSMFVCTKIAGSTFDDTLREATPVDPSRGHSDGPREATPVDPS